SAPLNSRMMRAEIARPSPVPLLLSATLPPCSNSPKTVASEKGKGSEFTIRFPVDIGSESPDRRNTLIAGNSVVLLAPAGAARTAIA
ncbi:hypothetical protein ACC696_38070, partial [Rhizobium ruizarguesonis]